MTKTTYGKIPPNELKDRRTFKYLIRFPRNFWCIILGNHIENTPLILNDDWEKIWYHCKRCGNLIYKNKETGQ